MGTSSSKQFDVLKNRVYYLKDWKVQIGSYDESYDRFIELSKLIDTTDNIKLRDDNIKFKRKLAIFDEAKVKFEKYLAHKHNKLFGCVYCTVYQCKSKCCKEIKYKLDKRINRYMGYMNNHNLEELAQDVIDMYCDINHRYNQHISNKPDNIETIKDESDRLFGKVIDTDRMNKLFNNTCDDKIKNLKELLKTDVTMLISSLNKTVDGLDAIRDKCLIQNIISKYENMIENKTNNVNKQISKLHKADGQIEHAIDAIMSKCNGFKYKRIP